jgi:hypothetical protein
MSGVKTYFIQCVSGGPVKVGKSANPEARLRQIQCHFPSRLLLLGYVDRDIERMFHDHFRWSHGLAGEWFLCDERLARVIRRISGATPIADRRTSPPCHVNGDYGLPAHDWRRYVGR